MLPLRDVGPVIIRGSFNAAVPQAWAAKDPAEIVLRQFEMPRIEPGVSIAQITPVIRPPGAVDLIDLRCSDDVISLRFMGGVGGIDAHVGIMMILSNGDRVVRSATLPIVQMIDIPEAPLGALTLNGMPVMIGNQAVEMPGSTLTLSVGQPSPPGPLTLDGIEVTIDGTPLGTVPLLDDMLAHQPLTLNGAPLTLDGMPLELVPGGAALGLQPSVPGVDLGRVVVGPVAEVEDQPLTLNGVALNIGG